MYEPKPWKEQTIPEKIGTVIAALIVLTCIIGGIMGFIEGDYTIAGMFMGMFSLLVKSILWIVLGAIGIVVILFCFPGIALIIIGAIAVIAIMIIIGLIAGVAGLFA